MVCGPWWGALSLLATTSLILSTVLHRTRAGFTLEQGIPHFNTKPYFLPPPEKDVTALEGQSAYLHCRVAQLGDKKVSWIRRRDLHVLTSGVQTFASDQRFLALHADRSENWTLQIRFSQVRDSGEYQCQVNTDPLISTTFTLNVLEAATLMEGSDQRYVRAGSTIQLTCRTTTPSESPGLLYWYRDTEILHEGERVRIKTNLKGETVSRLTVEQATVADSGNYTCWPTKFTPASVMVHVKTEEKAAAKSDSTANNGSPAHTTQEVKSSTSGTTTNASTTLLQALLPPLLLLILLYHLPWGPYNVLSPLLTIPLPVVAPSDTTSAGGGFCCHTATNPSVHQSIPVR